MTYNDIIATMSEMLPLEIQLNYRFANFYNKCKSHESQLAQTIIMVTSSSPMSLVGTIPRIVIKVIYFTMNGSCTEI